MVCESGPSYANMMAWHVSCVNMVCTCPSGRVAAGAIAEKWLRLRYGIDIVAWVRYDLISASCLFWLLPQCCVSYWPLPASDILSASSSSVGPIHMDVTDDLLSTITREHVDANAIRCPDETAAAKMIQVCPIALSLVYFAVRQQMTANTPGHVAAGVRRSRSG
jgi:hypothetical protein